MYISNVSNPKFEFSSVSEFTISQYVDQYVVSPPCSQRRQSELLRTSKSIDKLLNKKNY